MNNSKNLMFDNSTYIDAFIEFNLNLSVIYVREKLYSNLTFGNGYTKHALLHQPLLRQTLKLTDEAIKNTYRNRNSLELQKIFLGASASVLYNSLLKAQKDLCTTELTITKENLSNFPQKKWRPYIEKELIKESVMLILKNDNKHCIPEIIIDAHRKVSSGKQLLTSVHTFSTD